MSSSIDSNTMDPENVISFIPANGGKEKRAKKLKQLIKIAIPHVALYLLLLGYLLAGAWVFTQVESGADRAQRASKMAIIEQIYKNLSNEMRNACAPHDKRIFDEELYATLSILSQFMENNKNFRLRPYENYELDDVLPLRWTSISSILYALSILTTTGYGHVTPMTTLGQWLSIGYGLFGIPLMILGAVDIGRFLSDVVLFSYAKIEHTSNHLSQLFGFTWKTSTMISQVETKAIKILQNGSHLRNSFSSRHKSCGDYALMRNLTDGSSPTKPNGVHTSRKRKRVKYQDASPSKKTQIKKHLPLSVNAAILLIFCMLGGLVYMAAGGKKDTFIEGFFVTFNLVANLTMSELPTDVSRLMTVVYIFVFVTFDKLFFENHL